MRSNDEIEHNNSISINNKNTNNKNMKNNKNINNKINNFIFECFAISSIIICFVLIIAILVSMILFIVDISINYGITRFNDNILFVQTWSNDINNFVIKSFIPSNYDNTYPEYCDVGNIFDYNKIQLMDDRLKKYWVKSQEDDYKLYLRDIYDRYLTCISNHKVHKSYTEYNQMTHDYFALGIKKHKEYDLYNILKKNNIIPSNYKHYDLQHTRKILTKQFGYEPIIKCEDNMLSEIAFCYEYKCIQKSLYFNHCYKWNLIKSNCSSKQLSQGCKGNTFIYKKNN